MERHPRFAEFFAGIGLVRLAIESLGWDCVFANDNDKRKAAVYRDNFGDDELLVRGVEQITAADLQSGLDLVTASFPCIDLSLAGNRAGLAGVHSGTFWEFHRVLEELLTERHPVPLVLIENVDAFLTSHGGHDLESAVRSLNQLGYRCDAVIVDARHFAPQSRKRLFLICEHTSSPFDVLRPVEASDLQPSQVRPLRLSLFIEGHPQLRWGRVDFPALPASRKRLDDIVEETAPDSPLWWSESDVQKHISAMQAKSLERLRELKRTKEGGYGTIYRRTRQGRWRAELRTDGIAGCLRTTRGGSGKQFLVVVRGGRVRMRNMMPLEYARLQGIPDSARFKHGASANQALYALGDAVCVPLVRWIARHAFKGVTANVAGSSVAV